MNGPNTCEPDDGKVQYKRSFGELKNCKKANKDKQAPFNKTAMPSRRNAPRDWILCRTTRKTSKTAKMRCKTRRVASGYKLIVVAAEESRLRTSPDGSC